MKLKTLYVRFDNQIGLDLIPAFRGAVIEKVGRESVLFHNHTDASDKLTYRYPLIQYKSVARRPAIFCIGEGTEEIHKLFGFRDWDLTLNGKPFPLKVEKIDLNSCLLKVGERPFTYTISNWLALNSDNFKIYKAERSMTGRIKMLEKMLTANILSFATGVGWKIDQELVTTIEDVTAEKVLRYKGVPLQAFDLRFCSNAFIPNYLGLGKSVSHGFGIVKIIKNFK